MTRISRPIVVMAFAGAMIFGAALLLSSVINSAERPIVSTVAAQSPD